MPRLLRLNYGSLGVVLVGLVAAVGIGWAFARSYPLPAEAFTLQGITADSFQQYEGSSFLPGLTVWGILRHNLEVLLVAALVSVLSFGSLAVLVLMAPVAIIGFVAVQAAYAGYNPFVFVATFVLPHGVLELPAAVLATAAAVRLGISAVYPTDGMTISQSWLQALAHFLKLFLLVVVPLLAVAALVEVNITPQIVVAVYGS